MQVLKDNRESANWLFETIRALDMAITNHDGWVGAIHQTLVCDDPHPNPGDLRGDSHQRCRFGCWYGAVTQPALRDDETYRRLGDIHQRVHAAARRLLEKRLAHEGVSAADYAAFTGESTVFKLEVRNLQFELMSRVCVIDHLTGAWNRYAMHHRLTQEQERVARAGTDACVALMDLDHFKEVNDLHGHLAGDCVLNAVISHCMHALRKYDTVFRFGGEEFLFCLPDASVAEAARSIERIRAGLEILTIPLPDGGDVSITASFGVTALGGDKHLDDIIQEADHALLCAKAGGRNQVCQWGEG